MAGPRYAADINPSAGRRASMLRPASSARNRKRAFRRNPIGAPFHVGIRTRTRAAPHSLTRPVGAA
jgi:hypothetical protein